MDRQAWQATIHRVTESQTRRDLRLVHPCRQIGERVGEEEKKSPTHVTAKRF